MMEAVELRQKREVVVGALLEKNDDGGVSPQMKLEGEVEVLVQRKEVVAEEFLWYYGDGDVPPSMNEPG